MRRILRTRPTLLGAVLAGAAFATALPSTAANILNNGSFGSDLGGWTASGPVQWSPDGATTPGSVRIGGNPGIVGALTLSQCVAVAAGGDYDLGAAALLPYSSESEGGVSVRVTWHDGAACSGEPLGITPALDFPPVAPQDWTRRSLGRLRAPGGAVSASVLVVPWSSGTASAFSAFLDDVELAPSPRFVKVTVPTAASVDGARGERFRTTLVLTNPALVSRRVDVALRCRSDAACGSAAVSLMLSPHETRVFADALLDIFNKRNGAGALELTYDATLGPIVASARAATVHAERPGNGMALPVVTAAEARTTASFSGLSDGRGGDGGTRVNAGAYNPGPSYVFAWFTVHDGTGPVGSTVIRYFAPGEWAQIDDLFTLAGAGPVRPGSFVTFASEGPVFPFLIAIDNRSGDPTFLEPRESFQP
jgi:hypothetical protein